MKPLRLAYRFLAFMFLTLLVVVLRVPGRWLLGKHPRADRAWRDKLFRFWGRNIVRAVNIEVEIRGTPPAGPGFMVSNHLGYIDIAVLAKAMSLTFIAKSEIAGWPFIGPAVRVFDSIFINRERASDLLRANEAIRKSLDRGERVLLFAEGTSSGGEGILPLKPSLLQVPAERNLPVYVATLYYETPPGEPTAYRHVCWWGGAPFMPHLKGMLAISRIKATLTFVEATATDSDRKKLASKLHALLEKNHIPITPDPE